MQPGVAIGPHVLIGGAIKSYSRGKVRLIAALHLYPREGGGWEAAKIITVGGLLVADDALVAAGWASAARCDGVAACAVVEVTDLVGEGDVVGISGTFLISNVSFLNRIHIAQLGRKYNLYS